MSIVKISVKIIDRKTHTSLFIIMDKKQSDVVPK